VRKEGEQQGVCKSVTCTQDSECEAATGLPSQCTDGQCVPKQCIEDGDCLQGMKCFSDGNCKTDNGPCKYDCDCSECDDQVCFKDRCFCIDDSDQCKKPLEPPTEIITTARPAPGNSSTTPPPTPPPTTTPAPPPSDCPAPPGKPHGDEGDPCVGHSGCFADSCLICVRKEGEQQGVCKSVTCTQDSECEAATGLPSQCTDGQCVPKQCKEDGDCLQGMKCFQDGNCKTVYGGSCKFDCDCTECEDALCYKDQCFCKDDSDQCSISNNGTSTGGYGQPEKGGYGQPEKGGYGQPETGGYGQPGKGGNDYLGN